jgi:hypothetical protein
MLLGRTLLGSHARLLVGAAETATASDIRQDRVCESQSSIKTARASTQTKIQIPAFSLFGPWFGHVLPPRGGVTVCLRASLCPRACVLALPCIRRMRAVRVFVCFRVPFVELQGVSRLNFVARFITRAVSLIYFLVPIVSPSRFLAREVAPPRGLARPNVIHFHTQYKQGAGGSQGRGPLVRGRRPIAQSVSDETRESRQPCSLDTTKIIIANTLSPSRGS